MLFVVTAGLFVAGVSTEPEDHDESSEVTEPHDETAAGAEEGDEVHDEEEAAEGAGESHDEEGEEEKILGVDVESPGPIAAAVVVSLLLAGLLWIRPTRPVGAAGLVVGLGFAGFDVAEVIHQLDESRTGFALLACAVALGHIAAGICAGRVAWNET